ncbi:helix-turn-helix transcriptional regulator [Crenothrix polyspora]|uniref:Putative transcriptional regulator n=1 Tax=Crenothrix polyspora TaxID=360316 RepID=A0A1R4HFD9_9GAMM|nr:HTH domain-containing protein [Crenothrix polyspora]SJM94610.1 putative transcriptional regulator [Crenothrix polyspora]
MADHIGSRQRQLLELLLENKEGLCIDDMAKALTISRNAVQQHISVLELEGYLQAGELNKTAGRPVRRYVLTEAGINSFPKQYAWFSMLMLGDLKNEIGSEAFQRYMSKLGDNLSQSYKYRFTGKPADERREELLKIMDDLGFKTGSKTDLDSNDPTTIKAYNCIFHDLAQKHNEICQFDIALMTSLLEKDVELVECMAKGSGACCFKILNK